MGSRFMSWSVSEKGRRFFAHITGVAAFAAFGAHVIPNSIGLGKYMEFMQTYSSGVATTVPNDVLHRAFMVLEECNLENRKADSYKFFSVVGLDTFHAGSPMTKQGVIIGIPHNFRYKKEEDIERDLLLVDRESFNFDSSTGKSLLGSILLSERAQKFAIAKEILAADSYYVYMYGAVAALATLFVYSISNALNTKLGLLHKVPVQARLTMYALNGLMGITLYCFMKDALNHYFDKKADEAACKMGKDYALGGVEFYEKVLERNRALREAMGKKGRRLYTLFGNEEVWIRTKRLPVSAHLDIVKDMVKEMEKPSNVPEQQTH